MTTITPVLMSGGSGTRLWPLSRRGRPKQFHALGGEHTLIQKTALRFAEPGYEAPIVICNTRHADLVAEQLAAIDRPPSAMILEPEGRHTAAAAVASALEAEARGAELVLLLSADARVQNPAALRTAIAAGTPAAQAGSLVIFGIRPTHAETGYGYIRAADGEGPVRKVAAFVEKPDPVAAQQYLADPAYSWNAGIFLFAPTAFLAEARRVTPDLTAAAEAAFAQAARSAGDIQLGAAFARTPSVPVDVAVFEKTDKALVVSADIGWSDVGVYGALWAEAEKTASGDVLQGPVIAEGTAGNLVISDGPTVALSGVENLVIVVEGGVVMVAPRDDPAAVKALVERLKAQDRSDLT